MTEIITESDYTREELERLQLDEIKQVFRDTFEKEPHHKAGKESLITKLTGDPGDKKEEEEEEEKPKALKPKETSNPAFTAKQSDKTGIVRVKLTNPKRTASLRVRDYNDEDGQLRQFKDEHGRMRVGLIKRNFNLDLSKEKDRLYYEHLKDHPVYVKGNIPALTLENQYQEAIDEVELQELAMDAKNIVMKLKESELRDFSRIIGVKVAKVTSTIVVKQKVYDMCDDNPQHIIEMWGHPQKETHLIVRKAIDNGVLVLDGPVYKFNQVALGGSPDEVILYLMNNPEILPTMRNKIENVK